MPDSIPRTAPLDIFSLTLKEWAASMKEKTHGKGTLQLRDLYRAVMRGQVGFDLAAALDAGRSPWIVLDDFAKKALPSFETAEAIWSAVVADFFQEVRWLKHATSVSDSATTKFLFTTYDGYLVESVVVPMKQSATLCISSQVGCKMGCSFCETGRMGLLRHLTASEIVQQVYLAQKLKGVVIKNIVFMGMGEPFDNYDAVLQASRVLMDMDGLGFGRKNITISTSGRVAEIRRFSEDSMNEAMPNLAISLNAAANRLRNSLMPHNRKEPLEVLVEAASEYIAKTKREILFAYVLLQGVNDGVENALEVVHLLMSVRDHIRINIIPYNPQTIDRFAPPEGDMIDLFVETLRENGMRVFLRHTKGRSIMAGCGQLGKVVAKAASIS